MATPITWRNISAPSFGESNRLLQSATKSLTDSLGNIESSLDERLDNEQQAWNKQKEVNTQNLLNQIRGTNDLDSHGELVNQLTPESLQSQFGNQVDTQAIFDALGQRDNQIRQDEIDTFNHQDLLRTRKESPIKDQVGSLIASKDFKGAQALLDQHELNNESALFQQLQQAQRANVIQGREDAQYNRTQTIQQQQDQIGLKLQELATSSDNPVEARAKLDRWMRDNNINGSLRLGASGQVDTAFQQAHQLSASQMATLEAVQATAEQDSQNALSDAQFAYDDVKRLNPIDDVYSFSDQQKVTEGEGIDAILAIAPEDTAWDTNTGSGGNRLIEDFVSPALDRVRKTHFKKEGAIPGQLIQIAAAAGRSEGFFTDNQFNTEKFEAKLVDVVKAYKQSKKNEGVQLKARQAFENTRNSIQKRAQEKYSKQLSSFKNLNKNIYSKVRNNK